MGISCAFNIYSSIYLLVSLLLYRTILAALLLILGKILRKKYKYDREFQSPFECGFSTFNDYRLKFSLHFFLIALVFIIFDVELIILFPFFSEYLLYKSLRRASLFVIFLFLLS